MPRDNDRTNYPAIFTILVTTGLGGGGIHFLIASNHAVAGAVFGVVLVFALIALWLYLLTALETLDGSDLQVIDNDL